MDEKKNSANFKDGILSIDLPKTKVIEPKSRKIKIS
ncbi:MAG: Hsp20 family protein [Candidatus Neomarinimicrobiota bacterium]